MTKMQQALKPLGVFVAGCALALACVFGFAGVAQAQTENVSWSVTYNADKQMVSDYDQAAIDEKLSSLQPGDSFTMSVTLNNDYSSATDWYMTSDAVKTLEEASSASNGAYTYQLIFNDRTIYSSDTVGGDGANGFKEIDGATGKWFFLGSIDPDATGTVRIEMSLDGETQGNAYMNTLGTLNVAFAVEESGAAAGASDQGSTLTKTNDPFMLALYAIGIVAAVACIAFSLVSLRKLHKGRDAQ